MERIKFFNMIIMALTLLAVVPIIECQVSEPVNPMLEITPRPLCASQIALANYACGRLPFTLGTPHAPPLSPPPPPSPDDGGGDEEHRQQHHRHGHRHGHGHRHRHHQTADEENCCRWAKEVDDQCVCELLIRLPPFLVRPLHEYTLNIGESCEVTYSCGAPI